MIGDMNRVLDTHDRKQAAKRERQQRGTVTKMASDKKVVTLEEHEQRLMVRGLADYRNDAIRDGKPTDDIDDLLLKVIDAPPKRKRGLWRNEAR